MKNHFLTFFICCWCGVYAQPTKNPLLEKGWAELVKDNDNDAFRYFWQAHGKATRENNTADKAESLLYLGICSFGASLEKGLQYATQSLGEFKKLKPVNGRQATIGRSKCLQLIGTIYARQKKFAQAKQMSQEVVAMLKNEGDSTGTLGLAYSALGNLYLREKKIDSSGYFLQLALSDFRTYNNYAYLPNAYVKIGELKNNRELMSKGLAIADSTHNKQAQVSALLALGKWEIQNNSPTQAEIYFTKAHALSHALTDKLFEIKSLEALIGLQKTKRNFMEVSQLQTRLLTIKDDFYSLEREQIVKSLEVQFEVSEKNRELAILSKEKEVSRMTNIFLAIGLFILVVVLGVGYFFLKGINRRDKQLLTAKQALVEALEKQKMLQKQQFQNDLEHKESQLSATTLQMLQKNELLDEIKLAVENQDALSGTQLLKMVNKRLAQDNSWSDFDLYFESVNKNFYTRLKQSYPDISANDLKICALIKLNLSIKEMASILNISPDSVKTARYRLRKKLQLATEENLTGFILSI